MMKSGILKYDCYAFLHCPSGLMRRDFERIEISGFEDLDHLLRYEVIASRVLNNIPADVRSDFDFGNLVYILEKGK